MAVRGLYGDVWVGAWLVRWSVDDNRFRGLLVGSSISEPLKVANRLTVVR